MHTDFIKNKKRRDIMRRLWAHFILAITTLIVIFATFSNVFTNVKSNLEYASGYEVVYNVSEKDTGIVDDGLTPAQNIAKSMQTRLENYGVSEYQIYTEGEDTVKVVFANSDILNEVASLLSFNGTLALTLSITGPVAYGSDFLAGKAYVDEINDIYPTVVIPVNVDNGNYQALIDALKEQTEGGIDQETGEEDEQGNPQTETHYYAFLWYDFDEDVDNYTLAQEDTNEGKHCKNKIMMNFDRDELYYPDGNDNKLSAVINIADSSDENAQVSPEMVASAYKRAKFFVNLLNAGSLDYDVKYLYSSNVAVVSPEMESIIYLGDPHSYVAWSHTVIASLISVIVISLFLIMFYRLGALTIATTSLLSVFASVGFIVALGAEFTTAGVIGLILVGLASLSSGVIYFAKFKSECYKGRSIKKANSEASKKSLLPTVDIHVVLIIAGVFMYIFGGAILRTFALVSVLGGIASLIINLAGIKGLAWLLTNATYTQGKYALLGVDQSKVPDFAKEEKQSFFGVYAEKDFTKKKKWAALGACVLFLASVGGMLGFGLSNVRHDIYNYASMVRNSEIFFQTTETNSTINNSTKIDSILSQLYVYQGEDEANAKALISYKNGLESYTISRYVKNDVQEYEEVTYFFHTVSLKSPIDENYNAFFRYSGSIDKLYEGTVNEVFESVMSNESIVGDNKSSANLKSVMQVNYYEPKYTAMMLGTTIALAAMTLYLILRYRLSRGLSSIILPFTASAITIGIFVLIRVVVSPFISLAMPFIATFAMMATIIILDKERELLADNKGAEYDLVQREEISLKANSMALDTLGVITISALYIGVCFFGFGAPAASSLFIAVTLGILLSIALIVILFMPLSNILFKRLKKVDWFKTDESKPRRKKKPKVVKKSAEPEEAIFIGIND